MAISTFLLGVADAGHGFLHAAAHLHVRQLEVDPGCAGVQAAVRPRHGDVLLAVQLPEKARGGLAGRRLPCQDVHGHVGAMQQYALGAG